MLGLQECTANLGIKFLKCGRTVALYLLFQKKKKKEVKEKKKKIAETSSLVSGEHEAKHTGVSFYLPPFVL